MPTSAPPGLPRRCLDTPLLRRRLHTMNDAKQWGSAFARAYSAGLMAKAADVKAAEERMAKATAQLYVRGTWCPECQHLARPHGCRACDEPGYPRGCNHEGCTCQRRDGRRAR